MDKTVLKLNEMNIDNENSSKFWLLKKTLKFKTLQGCKDALSNSSYKIKYGLEHRFYVPRKQKQETQHPYKLTK